MNKKLFIKTFGCAMNMRDSEHIITELQIKENYSITENAKEADLIIINTCSVREKPERKLFSEIGIYSNIKKQNAKIGICGCTASALGEKIIKKAPSVDFVLGARNVSKISKVISIPKAVEVATNYDESNYEFCISKDSSFRALINISIGCDKKCSYCIVPHTRGKEISIPLDMILKEAEFRAKNGAKEIILLGQNVNNYGARFSNHHRKVNFTNLLQEVSKIDGIQRIKFVSPHPLHMDDEFIEEFAYNKKISKYIHMPLQSGSNNVLKDMKRGYSKEWFLNRVEKIKKLVPNVGIGSDIIVAFPTESEDDFKDTLDVVKEVGFDTLYSFIYSPRENTSAFNLEEIPRDVALSRLETLQNLHREILKSKAKKEINNTHRVMIENVIDSIEGRSDNGRLIKIEGSKEVSLGEIYDVVITKNENGSLFGKIA
ncbi:tRNA (N6-isopentenyl adenosine(37)-C2)-methylthiotransferase MiaB [Helicobacter sp. MIT 14-3879]|uniref:tRNA (N6-isopentenyl adenosine(37)-C2)-methylthiotransferase MiaB n=1 Tax=Helicobacter sp. MIT 14-3879 TaxID=2040649 RepID=UPI000E1F7B36|nr:tRNA (N6-isopentenyl adenosine(37)-C2)-methylthiotransferase MiaB [Helicobacter sp. MIT 14-3879]RDU64180.1 tRNA (N6-isopentenyl adenosine(37)-C2)-methylthiotransferase MiaB [Helicobacter sp. MIT 14-3879]